MNHDTPAVVPGRRRGFLRGAAALVLALALPWAGGCNDSGGDGGDDTKDEPAVDLTGLWTLSFEFGAQVAMYFEQNGKSVQGVGQDQSGAPYSFAGTVEDKTLKGTLLPEAELKAKIEGASMGGTYKTPSASGSFTGSKQ